MLHNFLLGSCKTVKYNIIAYIQVPWASHYFTSKLILLINLYKIEQHQCESVITWQGEYHSWSTWDLCVALLAALWDGKALFNPTQIFTQCTIAHYVTRRSTMSSRVQQVNKMKNYRENL
jgi:hypothetical protein